MKTSVQCWFFLGKKKTFLFFFQIHSNVPVARMNRATGFPHCGHQCTQSLVPSCCFRNGRYDSAPNVKKSNPNATRYDITPGTYCTSDTTLIAPQCGQSNFAGWSRKRVRIAPEGPSHSSRHRSWARSTGERSLSEDEKVGEGGREREDGGGSWSEALLLDEEAFSRSAREPVEIRGA